MQVDILQHSRTIPPLPPSEEVLNLDFRDDDRKRINHICSLVVSFEVVSVSIHVVLPLTPRASFCLFFSSDIAPPRTMKFLQRGTLLMAALLVAPPTVLAADSDVTIWSCLPSSTTLSSPSESPSTSTASPEASETLSSVPDSSSTAEASTETSVAACEGTAKPSSSSTSTALPSTTSLAIPVHIGAVNASSLEWTIVWRRCNMPATRSPF
ncbi:uncharacterized protein B0H64DRAFT_394761 [Chaetomium fimeti]|uniref:Uncharacterized protein n=1 Tax=Chaetomium fimeti TaxID=1854472 RepID=A0AAE0LSK2_9PEZI|nr:hypothetical protein B0H64DRAFT_394761 [Chaetomium fimeti]